MHSGPTGIVNTPLQHWNSELTVVGSLSVVLFRGPVNITDAKKMLVSLHIKVLAHFCITACIYRQ